MYETILIPTDGSEGATAAARHGLALAAAFESEVHLLSVVDERAFSASLADVDAEIRNLRDTFEREATDAIEDLETLADEASVPARTAVESGVPAEAIRTYADDHGVDLVAMGTHGRTGLDRLLLGSVTERVVRTSDVPVLTCRHEPDEAGYERVLVPTDGSDAASAAVEHGLAIADRFDATVHALSVVDVGTFVGAYEGGPGVADLLESVTANCETAVDAVAERCDDRGLDVVTAVRQGSPVGEIRDYAAGEGIDLVTMGTHGRSGLERYLLGSVTERTVRTSEVPVLTTRTVGED